jgi:hypothetical protein
MIKSVKPKKCVCGCGDSFVPRRSTDKWVNSDHYKHWLLNTPQGQREIERKALRAKKQVQKDERVKDKKLKNEITDWNKKLQIKVQEIARLIDRGQPCLARGYTDCQFHGGHVISRGAGANTKLNLHNIHRQSAQSNHWQNDDALMKRGLELEYGINYLNFVEELRRCPVPKYTNEDYHVFYSIACGVATRLKKAEKEYGLEERIELRNQINLELGIYSEEYCIYN